MKNKIKDWLKSFLYAVLVVGIMFFTFWPMKIEGHSMQNTFFNNDRIMVSRALSKVTSIEAGDIIIARVFSEAKDRDINIIKRVIATPGDKIKINNNNVYVNDIIINENYLKQGNTYGEINITLGYDEYFIMGDNRNKSLDSRQMGAISSSQIKGMVLFRWHRGS
jgi:signal peptidase I